MGKIFVIMGKTSSGKDTVFKQVLECLEARQDGAESIETVVIYTTRPMRPGEINGLQYFFVSEKRLEELRQQGKVMEERCYHTVHGPWYYFTVNDGQIDLENHSYLMINTLAGFEMIRSYYNKQSQNATESNNNSANGSSDIVIPIYIEADPKDRLLRYISRESLQEKPNYSEVCRRFLADESDFSDVELARLGITKRYRNQDLEACCREVEQDIKLQLEKSAEHPQDAAL